MAIGAVTVVEKTQILSNPVRADLLSFPGDGAYATGGTAAFQASVRTALLAAGVKPNSIEILAVIPQWCGAYGAVYDKANDKLVAIVLATGVEVAAAFDLSGTTFQVLVLSK